MATRQPRTGSRSHPSSRWHKGQRGEVAQGAAGQCSSPDIVPPVKLCHPHAPLPAPGLLRSTGCHAGGESSSSSLLHLLLNHPFPPAQPCSGCPWDVALLSFTNKGFRCQGSPTASQRHRELREEQPTRHCRNGGSCPSAPFMALLEMWEREPGGERKAEPEPWAVSPVQRQPPALMPGEKEQGSIREPEQSVQ